ncbi:hypothetical protein B0H17DRAFT_1216964 [Mycena rosella]|uniref:Uncharacterized protein n=1 Tax=Mycena rosella TaxID=1033263 RepID=A0AAD7C3C3_MYCRO|nr:hypothetical protein B0H17DRAFT_1216964 [Mycena rosella]
MQGLRFNLMVSFLHYSIVRELGEVQLHGDVIHHAGEQVIPTLCRVMYAASLLAHPALEEPVFLVEILPPTLRSVVLAV